MLGLNEVGGYNEVFEKFPNAQPNNRSEILWDQFSNKSCSEITPYYKGIYRPIDDMGIPWTGQIFGCAVTFIWYWCADQVINDKHL